MAVSSDGVVTATVDTTTASILLVVDFTVPGAKLNGASAAAATVTVTETNSGRMVRGLTSTLAPGTIAVGIDHEAAFDTTLTYSAHVVSHDSSGGFDVVSQSVSVTLPSPTLPSAWLKSLSSPASSVSPIVAGPPQWSAGIAQGVIQVIGSPYPVVVSDVRQAKTGTLVVYTDSATDTAAMENLLDNVSGPYLLQLPGYSEPDRYVTVGPYTLARADANAVDTIRTWSLPLTAVGRPDPTGWSVAIPGHTYADSTVKFPTYADRTGTYESRATG